MSRRLDILVLMLVAAAALASLSALPSAPPIGTCPPGFHIHEVSDHHDGQVHKHAGNSFDQNGDGQVCVKHVSADGSIHVHIDNVVRP